MKSNPYRFFNGQCDAAFTFYEQCLGGKIIEKITYGKSPMADRTHRCQLIASPESQTVFGKGDEQRITASLDCAFIIRTTTEHLRSIQMESIYNRFFMRLNRLLGGY